MVNPSHLQFNSLGHELSGTALEMCVNPLDITLRRTISAPVSIPDTFLDSSSLNVSSFHFVSYRSLWALWSSVFFYKMTLYTANSAPNMGGWTTKSLQHGIPTRKINIIYLSAICRYRKHVFSNSDPLFHILHKLGILGSAKIDEDHGSPPI